jgi:4,5-dihydroxyphthalate decarboxylase
MTATDDRIALTLRTALDTYGHTAAIKDGRLAAEHLRFDFVDVRPMNRAFAPMAMEQTFDFSEMAIVTVLQALAFGKPLVLLPLVMLNRFHHGSIVVLDSSPIRAPKQLEGTRVGVRAYSTTTATWTRGILHGEYGVDLDTITFVTQEGAHVADYDDPPSCVRVSKERSLAQLLLDGEIDAWIGGRDVPRVPDFRPVVPDAERAELDWFARVGALPINHMAVLRRDLFAYHPWIAEELFTLLARAKREYLAALTARGASEPEERFRERLVRDGRDPLPMGVAALRPSLELIVAYAHEQGLIPRPFAVDELFDPRMLALEERT